MNIYDIAREAGVSITTVSRVINNKQNISAKTKEKVETILKKHNYTPNAFARGLMSSSIKSIGVVTVDIRDPHYANTAFTIEQDFSKLGYNVILCNTGGKTDESINYLRMLMEKKVDGIILIGSVFNDQQVRKYVSKHVRNLPIVLANGYLAVDNSYSVLVDDFYGISCCVEHLYAKKHTKIIYIKDAETYSGERKQAGFIAAMKEHGLPVDDTSIIKVPRGLEGGYMAVAKLVDDGKDFSAIIFGEDITAVGGIKKLKELGRRVPEDVAVTGFNNSTFAKCCDPELTSVDNKVETVASLSAKMLHDLIETKNVSSTIMIRPDLIIRKST
ncbi:LacI family DNA-binding transcriptional regulator [Sporomusa sp.]|uniref:LacI family DNA-binding transcriptional regulator n=1 Tax=Sporomusa sp. TaxID=2078658 RepID=UPI002C58743D|nr:LacI family DNA-binding transcriptional regulator [Sporomusa sp.]HWR45647.1 LacI family DNA-binding transcriptional regulator [Sporomusa sp.]